MSMMNFAIYFAGDGYSTDKKIMGRQSAGKALIKGVARRWKTDAVYGYGQRAAAHVMIEQLKGDGYAGSLHWQDSTGRRILAERGALYMPGPLPQDSAHGRNLVGSTAYSLVGVTHTLSSANAMRQVAEVALPPFKPWDALICTSSAALSVVTKLQDELKTWHADNTGATRFNSPALPVIPLGINVPDFERNDTQRIAARQTLGLGADEIAFLFAGRITFHGKASPVACYQALEAACQRTGKALVCIEAGIYPNAGVQNAVEEAQRFFAPSVRFQHVDGNDSGLYDKAWKAADVFVSLSDNIQETFGLTPVEAMAAGIPVLVSDWDGYKDTVRDGVDGYRVPVTLPAAGSGTDLAMNYALGRDNYDYYIGRVSMATVVDLPALTDRVVALAESSDLRETLGAAGQKRAREIYDWPIILGRYVEMIDGLGELRKAAASTAPLPWPTRPDPFELFSHYPSQVLDESRIVAVHLQRAEAIETFLELGVARYVIDPVTLPRDTIVEVLRQAAATPSTIAALVRGTQGASPTRMRAFMWLYKLGLVSLVP
ncbi:glycosyltransferase family 4 protein [Caulobacter henricii]|uniref:Glycosyl transferase family 1 domain-containing protein n=1 Tax=Caulobacter henricii TaxID=69395 RepID=A0A0P0P1R0_9CAUL|nr:glycosyltransferase family 4 protein [Caulobacter henricii]ALL14228.1 hypothetical protein AQ619_13245 [Caulobacter henricii]